MLQKGLTSKQEKTVLQTETAKEVKSGSLEVFATPSLIAFMEHVAFSCVEPYLNPSETTVGIAVNIQHLKANLVGDQLSCTAILSAIEGKKLFFDIEVSHNSQLVGKGTHTRYIIDKKIFLDKLNS